VEAEVKVETARAIANAVVGAAVLGAAVVILRTPTLRRLAFRLARTAIVTGIPAWLAREVNQAWQASGHRGSSAPAPPGRAS
jgi:hypothetical protein